MTRLITPAALVALVTLAACAGTGDEPALGNRAQEAAATQLQFAVQPSSQLANVAIAPAIQVEARDGANAVDTDYTGTITLAIAANPASGTLAGTVAVAAVAGVATFPGLSIDNVGVGYTLTASSAGLTDGTSAAFDIVDGAATHVAFVVEPTSAVAGVAIAPAITVAARDALGNTDATFTGDVTLAIAANPGSGALSGTATVAAVAGVATFAGLSIDQSGVGYTLSAAATGLGGDTSAAFSISAAAATALAVSASPATTAAGVALAPAPVIVARDAFGNVATGFTGTVTLALAANPGGSTLSGTSSVAAVGGVAAFPGLSLNKVGTGYQLAATATGLTAASTATFDIVPGVATHLTITGQPSDVAAGAAIAPAIVVEARDTGENLATGFTGTVALALGSNPGGATLGGTTSVAAVAGVATLAAVSLDKVGTGYTLTASSGALTFDESASFDVTPGAAATLAFTVQPSNAVAGVALAPAVQVTARDAFANVATDFTGMITVSKASGTGTLSGTATVAAVAGVATFGGLSLDLVGAKTLGAAAAGLTGATSAAFSITPAAATNLVFTVQPATTVAGVSIAPAVVVTARDAFTNTATGFIGTVTMTRQSGPGTLGGTTSVAAVGGVASFAALTITQVGTYALAADASGLTGAVSSAFAITSAAATNLVFTVQPSNVTAGVAIAPAVQVTARDGFNNVASGFTGLVTIAKASGPASGNLSGTVSVAAAAGVATFANLILDKSGSYSLGASASGLSGATSGTFNVGHAAATHLVFTTQPATATAGVALAPAVVVEARDAFENAANSFNSDVTVAIGTNPSAGTLSGTTTVAASSGAASFATLAIDKSGAGYTLTATGGGLTAATSATFTIIAAAATHLAYTVQPSTTVAGVAIAPPVQVVARDAFDNLAISFVGTVAIAIAANPGTATLSGTASLAATGGVATFANLSLDKVGVGYTLGASATGLTAATSAAFTILPGAATNLTVTVQPSTTVAGVAITPAVVVSARDGFGNLATGFTGNVTVALGANPGASTLSGTTTVAAVAGVASFATLSLDKVAAGYTLAAAATGLTGATTAAFAITPAAPHHLAFAVQPSTVIAGVAISPAVVVQARDAFDNVATSFNSALNVALAANPGSSTLSGTTTVTAAGGVATFATLSLNKTAAGYTLGASAAGLIGATSTAFAVTPAAADHLVYAANPSNAVAGVAIAPAIVLIALDPFDNVATGFTSSVALAIGANPGGSTLGGITSVAATAGVVTFTNVSLNKVGAGYTLVAASAGLTSATSLGFAITPAAAAKLVFTVQPTNEIAGQTLTPAIQLVARDAFDNLATGFGGAVTIAIGNNPGGSNLLGTTTVTAVAGTITFATLSLNRVGSGYTLSATSLGLAAATSAGFDIVSGSADRVFFTVQPTTAVAGTALSPGVQITVRDALGNLASQFTGNVTVSIFANPGTSTLSGTTTVAAVGGVAQFVNLSLDKVGSGYTLLATGPGLVSATSTVFNVTPAAASSLAFSVQPTAVVAGVAFAPTVQVTAHDPFGNIATGFVDGVTLGIGANPGGSTLAGTATRAAVAGVAAFPGVSLDKVGTGYTLTAAAAALPTATSAGFAVSPAAPAVLVFGVEPATTAAGDLIAPPVTVEARDAFDNVATQFTDDITVALGANPGGSVLTGTTTAGATAGVAAFAMLSLDRAATGYTLTATGGGMAPATSASFDIVPSNASRLVFTVQPANGTAGVALAPTLRVEARDPSGNLDATFNGTVSVAIGANAAGGTLMGTVSMPASGGQVSFADLSLDKAGVGYTLVAATPGLVSATSTAFAIAPAAADHLVYVVQPVDSVAGAALAPAVALEARDAFDNVATGFTGAVAMAIGVNSGGSTLGGTSTTAAVAGRVSYADLSLDKVGAGYTLVASAAGLGTATSTAFEITAAPAARLLFTTQPSNVPAGQLMAPAVGVRALDAFGNPALAFTGAITLGIGANPGASTLAGTTTVVAVAGAASYGDLTLDGAAAGYTLVASASGLASATSATFTVMPGAASRLVFTVEPEDAVAGAAIAPAVVVAAHDAQGNLVPSFTGMVTIAIGTNPGAATLGGTATVAAVAGVATFPNLTLDRQASGYRLTATTPGFTSAVSATFAITPGTATRLAVAQQPTTTTAAAPITPAVQIAAEDAFGNRVTTFVGAVTIALGQDPAGATLGGTLTVTASSGIASFTTLTLDRAAVGYTLVATGGGLTMVETAPFDVVSGTAASIELTTQPSNVVAGAAIAPAITVTVRDSQGNVDTAFAGNVALTISNNPGAATLAGTVSVLVSQGVATFADVSLDKVGSGYTLAAMAAGVPSVTSAPFDVWPGPAATYVVMGLGANVVAGFAAPLTLTAHDAHGNVATDYAGTAALTSSDAAGEHPATVSFTAGVSGTFDVAFHTLGAQTLTATDNAVAAITATFDTNVTAVDAPTVQITSPDNGATVGGMVMITASGMVGSTTSIAMLEIKVDGVTVGTADTSPAAATWDATDAELGSSHTITAVLTDAEGNVVTSTPVVVTIEAAPDGCGCRTHGGAGTPLLLALVLLGIVVRPRRRRLR